MYKQQVYKYMHFIEVSSDKSRGKFYFHGKTFEILGEDEALGGKAHAESKLSGVHYWEEFHL